MIDPGRLEIIESTERSCGTRAAHVGDEPRAGIKVADLVVVKIGDQKPVVTARVVSEPSGDIGGPGQRAIMNDDRNTVSRSTEHRAPTLAHRLSRPVAGGLECVLRRVRTNHRGER